MERALRTLVREALKLAAEDGLPGNHHYYISFKTKDDDVVMPDHLRARYPEEMTIVLQHQFWGLEIDEAKFCVTLSFGGRSERLTIPFESVTAFMDPAVNFGLQFRPVPTGEEGEGKDGAPGGGAPPPAPDQSDRADAPAPKDGDDKPEDGTVVTLDNFRKK